jgi:predicted ATPase
MEFSSPAIADFRSIIKLDIHNFRRINLITGRNNCGKTTAVEALFQIFGMLNAHIATFFAMQLVGISINVLSLMGLSLQEVLQKFQA